MRGDGTYINFSSWSTFSLNCAGGGEGTLNAKLPLPDPGALGREDRMAKVVLVGGGVPVVEGAGGVREEPARWRGEGPGEVRRVEMNGREEKEGG